MEEIIGFDEGAKEREKKLRSQVDLKYSRSENPFKSVFLIIML